MPGPRGGELVGELGAGRHRRLGQVRHPVRGVAQRDAVPVQGRLGRQPVDQGRADHLTGGYPDRRSRDPAVVAPGVHREAAEVDLPRGGGQPEASHRTRVAGGLGGARLRAVRCHETIRYPQAAGAAGRGAARVVDGGIWAAGVAGCQQAGAAGNQTGTQQGTATSRRHRARLAVTTTPFNQ